MGFFDDLGSKLQNVAKKSGEVAQSAAKKSGDLLEIGKLNLKIKENEGLIKGKYVEIGETIFAKYENAEEVPEEFEAFINEIKGKKADIEELKGKIEEIKKQDEISEEETSETDDTTNFIPLKVLNLNGNNISFFIFKFTVNGIASPFFNSL